MKYSIIAAILLVVLLVIRSKKHKPFITNEVARICILVLSLILILSGISWLIFLLVKGKEFYLADYALATFLIGVAVTGFVAETPQNKQNKKPVKKKKR